jgi:hypothetical protein
MRSCESSNSGLRSLDLSAKSCCVESGNSAGLDDSDGNCGELFRCVPSLSQLPSITRLLRLSFALAVRTLDLAGLTRAQTTSSQVNYVQRLAKTSPRLFARIISTASLHTQDKIARTTENIETLKVQQDHIQA